MTAAPGALAGVRVLEFSEMIAAPFACMHLGDMGADVIKVEPPSGDPWRASGRFAATEGAGFLALNRNKRGLALDLKTEAGREVVRRLVPSMDVVIVNYRPDTPAALGIDYDSLRQLQPRLIYVQNTFLGSHGPDRHRPGYDLVAQASTGLLATADRTASDGLPAPITPAIADYGAGMAIACAVCAALFTRERTGVGQLIETSLLATALSLQGQGFMKIPHESYRPAVDELQQLPDEDRRALLVYYRVYRTKDSTIAVACLSPALQRKLTAVLGVEDPRHGKRLARTSPESIAGARQLTAEVSGLLASRTTDEWLAVFDGAGIPAAPVNRIDDMARDPNVIANGLSVAIDHPVGGRLTMAGPMWRMSATPTSVRRAPPTLGQHNAEVLAELGYSVGEISSLREQGALHSGPFAS